MSYTGGIELARAYVRVDADVRPYTAKMAMAEGATYKAAQGMDRSMSTAARQSTAAAKSQAAGWAQTAAAIGGSMGTVGRKATTMGNTVTKRATLPIAAGFAIAAKVAIDFEKQLDKLGSVSGANAKQMGSLRKQALKLGQDTIYSAGEVAQAQTELAKGGLKVKTILGGALPAALALAAAGEIELADAGATVANSLNQFGLKGKSAMRVADMLATAANRTTGDVGDFTMALQQGGSVAQMAGLSMNQTMVALEALAKASVKGSDAGTSLKTSMIQLLNPTQKQKDMANELGVSFINAQGEMKGMAQISSMLRRETGDMTKAQRTQAFAVLAGTDGVRTLNALYAAGPKTLRDFGRANLEQGTAAAIAKKQMDNTAGAIEEMMGALETTAIVIGSEVIPIVTEVAGVVGTAATAFGELPAPIRKTAVATGLVLAAAGPLMSMFGYMARGAGAVAGGLARIGGASVATSQALQTATQTSNASLLIANSSGVVTGEHYVAGMGTGVDKGTKGAGWRNKLKTGMGRAMPIVKGAGIMLGAAGLIGGIAEGVSLGARGGSTSQKVVTGLDSFFSTITLGATSGFSKNYTEIWDQATLIGVRALAAMPGKLAPATTAAFLKSNPSAQAAAEWLMPSDTQWKNLTEEQKVKFTQVYQSVKAAAQASARTGIKIPIDIEAPAPASLTKGWSTAFANLRQGVGTSMGDIDKLLNQSLNGIRQTMRTKPNQARAAMSGAFRAAAQNVLQSMRRGEIGTAQALNRIRKLMRNAQLVKGEDPFQIAQGFTSSWKKAGGISKRSIKDVIADLKMMPPGARQQAWNTMIQIGSGLARKKQIPIQQFRDLRSKVAVDLGLMRTRAVKSTGSMADGVNRNMGNLSTGIGSTYVVIRDNTNSALGAFGVKPINFDVSGIQGKAQGGYVDAPSRRDSALAMIGRDEAVLTRHQQGPVQQALAFTAAHGGGQYGSLGQLFAGERKPNYYARGKAPSMAGPAPLATYGQKNIDKVWGASKKYIDSKRPSVSVDGITYTGPPANMKKLGDADWVDTHTLAVGAYMANRFGVSITDGWRPADAGYGAPNSSHKRGTPGNPGALDFAPPSSAFQSFAGRHIAGLTENLMNDAYSTGPHNHLAFFARGGWGPGSVLKGRVSWFNGPASTTASGTPVNTPGLALNINPGSESGWNNSVTDGWMSAAAAGNPVIAMTRIQGHAAKLPIIDKGPNGFTGRAIDVTEAGVRKLGMNPGAFPTDAIGTARILGNAKTIRRAEHLREAGRKQWQRTQKLWARIRAKGTTANGRKRAVLARDNAREAIKAARKYDVTTAERKLEASRRQTKLAWEAIARRQAQKRKAGKNNKPNKPGTGGRPVTPGGKDPIKGLVSVPGVNLDSDHFDLLWAGIPPDVKGDLATYQRTYVGVQRLAQDVAKKTNAQARAEYAKNQYRKARGTNRKSIGERFDNRRKALTERFNNRSAALAGRTEKSRVWVGTGGVTPGGKAGGYWKTLPAMTDREIRRRQRLLEKREQKLRNKLDRREKSRKTAYDQITKEKTTAMDARIDQINASRQGIDDLRQSMLDIRNESYQTVKTGMIMQQTQLPLTAKFLGRYRMGTHMGGLPSDGLFYGHKGEQILPRGESQQAAGDVYVDVQVNGTIVPDGSGRDPLEVRVNGERRDDGRGASKAIGKRASQGRMTARGNRRVGGK